MSVPLHVDKNRIKWSSLWLGWKCEKQPNVLSVKLGGGLLDMRRAAAADELDAAAAGCVDDEEEDIIAILVRKEGVDVGGWTQIVNPALDFAARRARAAGCCPSAADEMGAKSWGPLSTGLKGRYSTTKTSRYHTSFIMTTTARW